ncbi:MAG: MBOAT family protein [Candidatus Zixiibacteriota bacterium]|nr:MAG: MBOAT family protein [candidate division Zixibacteria bacterium]
MNFNSLEFALFLFLVLMGYYLLRHREQNFFLLAASYLFYAWWDWRFLGLLLTTTLVDYMVGLRLAAPGPPGRRRAWLLLSLGVNLGILGTFKYYNFFFDSAVDLLGFIGLGGGDHLTLRFLLPVGISFYTFKSLSYTIDVYRGTGPATRNLAHYALYVAFFPQLVAGPIDRAWKMLPQFEKPRVITWGLLEKGLLLILLGYLKKVVIADNLGLLVYQCFNRPEAMSSLSLALGVYYFAFQIYFDFSGYTDIARGIAHLLGMNLMINFRQPYFSQSIREFWTRWHISLSRWLRDYVYTPLSYHRGLNRVGRNLLITMALCGLWHGATWNFVLWGVFFGVLQWMEWPLLRRRGEDFPNPPRTLGQWPGAILRMAVVFHLVCLSWILFRAPDLAAAWDYIVRLFSLQPGLRVDLYGVSFVLLGIALDVPQYLSREQTVYLRVPGLIRAAGYAGVFLLLALFAAGHSLPFIYARF